jgi:quercetin dioxygenase-like cupin family protein
MTDDRKTGEIYRLGDVSESRAASGRLYHEFLRVPALSAGLYVLPAGGADPQRPHTEDEVYVVLRGRAMFSLCGVDRAIGTGDTIYVAAGAEHRFHTIDEDLELIVVFAPAERG